MIRRLVAVILIIDLLIVNIAPVFAQPNLKLPWDSSLGQVHLTSGPHGLNDEGKAIICELLPQSYLTALDFGLYRKEVLAAASGTVAKINNDANTFSGRYVIIDHGNGWKSGYYHLESISVRKGDQVFQGTKIGVSGNTGTGAGGGYHLHFSVTPYLAGIEIDGYRVHTVDYSLDSSKAFNYLGTLTKGDESVKVVSGQCSSRYEQKVFGSEATADPEYPEFSSSPYWVSSTNSKVSGGSCSIAPGQGSSRQVLFQQAYDRKGGRKVMGCATTGAFWWAGMVRQDFEGSPGFGRAAILHDEPADNPKFSIPAYVVQGGFWGWYKNNSVFGPPASDHYINAFGLPQTDFRDGFLYWEGGANARRYFLKGSGSTLYLALGGRKHLIPNSTTKDALGYPNPVTTVSNAELARFPTGGPIPDVNNTWLAQYYDNMVNRRPAKVIRGEGDLNFGWGFDSPHPLIPKDNFSARFARYVDFPASGQYRFYIVKDDGGRLWIDEEKIFDEWCHTSACVGHFTVDRDINAGIHLVRFDYYEKSVNATARLWWDSLDKTGPQVSASFGVPAQGGGWFTGDVPVTIAASDPSGISQIAYQLDGRDPNGWVRVDNRDKVTLTVGGEGVRTLYYKAMDKVGNWSTEKSLEIPIDRTPPETDISHDGPLYENREGKLFVSAETQFSLEADDTNPADSSIEASGVAQTNYQIDESGKQVYEEEFSVEGEDGKHEIRYQSDDVAGNSEPQKSQEVYLDSTPPISSDDSDGEWHNEDVAVLIVSSDGEGSGVEAIYYSGAKEGIAEGDQVVVIFEDEGVHELSYYVVDNVENIEGEKHAALIKIDKTPPEITGAPTASLNENGWYNEDVIVHFEAEDQEHLSGIKIKSVTPDTTVSTEGYNQQVIGTAKDKAGNTASTTVGGINIDKNPPSSQLNELDPYYNNDPLKDNPIELTYTYLDNLSGVERIRLYKRAPGDDWGYHGGSSHEPTKPFNVRSLTEGLWEFASRAIDFADNIEDLPEEADTSTIYDITAPTSEITSFEESQCYYDPQEDLWYCKADNWPEVFGIASDNLSGVAQVEVQTEKDGEIGRWVLARGANKWIFDLTPEDGFYTIRSRASDLAGNQESTFAVSFVYDTIPPVTSAELSSAEGLNGWYVSSVGLTLSSDDTNPEDSGVTVSGVSQIWYRIEGLDSQVYESPLPFAEGGYTASYWAQDRAGNVESEKEVSFKIDTAAPNDPTNLISPSHTSLTWSADDTIDISWTAAVDTGSGVDGYSYVWDIAPNTLPSAVKLIEETVTSLTSPILADGNSHYFHLRTVDNAGNWTSTAHLGPFFIDTIAPSDPTNLTSTSHITSTWSSDNTVDLTWTAAADAGSGVDGYSYLWDTSATTLPDTIKDAEETATSLTSPALSDGDAHYFHIRTRDNVGNWTSTLHLGPFWIDTTPPESRLEPLAPYYNNYPLDKNPIEINFTYNDNLSGVQRVGLYKRQQGSEWVHHWTSASGNISDHLSVKTLIEGRWEFASRTTDFAGNVEDLPVETDASTIYDITPPQTSSDKPPVNENGWYNEDVEVTLDVTDKHPIYPEIETPGVFQTAVVIFKDGEPLTDGIYQQWDIALPFEEDGVYVIEFYSEDKAGNVEEPGGAVTVKLDKTEPISEIASLEEGAYYNADSWPGIFGIAGDNFSGVAQVEVWVDKDGEEGEWVAAEGTEDWSFNLTPEDGFYTVYSQATDLAGNQESTDEISFVYDATPPVTSAKLSGTNGLNSWYVSKVTLSLTAEDLTSSIAQVFYGIGGSDPQVYEDLLAFGDGYHTVEFWSVDLAGNEEEHQIVSFKIDQTPPEITGMPTKEPNKHGWYNDDVTVRFGAADNLSGIASVTGDQIIETEGAGQSVEGEAADRAGNSSTAIVSGINIDKTPPSSRLNELNSYYKNNPLNEDPIELTYTYLDNLSGVEKIRLYKRALGEDWGYHGGSSREPTKPFKVGTLDEGYWEFAACAIDFAGNVEGLPEEADTFMIYDITAPRTTAYQPEANENGWYSEDVEVTLEATDKYPVYLEIETSGVSQTSVSIFNDGELFADDIYDEWNIALPFEEDGIYTVVFYSEDRTGNIEEPGDTAVWLDKTEPTSEITSLEGSECYYDPQEDLWYCREENWPGIYGVADDNLSGLAQVEVRIDKDGEEGEWFTWEAEDGWSEWTAPGFDPVEGFYTAYSCATDQAGNRESTFVISFVYDDTSPITSAELSGTEGLNDWYVSPVTLTLNSFDKTSDVKQTDVIIIKDGEKDYHTLQYDSGSLPAFEDGSYVVEFWSVDLAGNEEEHQTISFRIDTVAPSVPVASIPGGTFTEGEIIWVNLTAEEGAKIYFSLNGGAFTLYSDPIAITDDATLSAYAEDEAGNRSELVEFNYTFNPVPQVLGIQSQETPGVSRGEGEVKGEEITVTTESDDPNTKGLGGWLILLAVLIGGVPYLLFRWRIFLRR